MQNGMLDITIPDEKDKDVRTTIMMDKQELQDYIDKLNDYYEVSYYEIARLDEPKKGYQKKYLTIDEISPGRFLIVFSCNMYCLYTSDRAVIT